MSSARHFYSPGGQHRALPCCIYGALRRPASTDRMLRCFGHDDHIQARHSAAALPRSFEAVSNPKRRLEAGEDLAGARRGNRSSAAVVRETLIRRLAGDADLRG